MDNDQVISAQDSSNQGAKPSKGKKILMIVAGIILILGIGTGSYFLGTKSKSVELITPTPFTLPEITSRPTPSDKTNEATNSASPSPTKKPSTTPTPTATPAIKQKTLSSSSALDGFQSSNGGGNKTIEVRAGRNINLVTRGFVSFDLSEIPSGVTIKEATLRLYQAKIIGNPYGAGGSLKVDHLNYGDSFENSDYGLAALSSSFITLTSNNAIEWKDAIVTDQIKDDLANARSRSQFRIHFQIENTGGDVTGDFAYFEASENNMATGNTPQLVVKYY